MNFDFLKRTTFWISALVLVGALAATAAEQIPAEWGAIAIASSSVAYSLSRGLAKYSADLKRGWKTTEFWYGVISIVVLGIGSLQFDWSLQLISLLTLITGILYQMSRGLADVPVVAANGLSGEIQTAEDPTGEDYPYADDEVDEFIAETEEKQAVEEAAQE